MPKPLTKDCSVLVVGAGPTGLAAAATLAKLGISVRVIDKNQERSDKSKALGVQAGTLECLDAVFGFQLSEEMVKTGRPAKEAWIHLEDKEPMKVNLSSIPSRYNYILVLEQSETERLLEKELNRLGVQVERQTELMTATENGTIINSTIKRITGETSHVESEFVIGCDGAHSTVRRLLGMPFEGAAYDGEFILGDVKIELPWSYNTTHSYICKRGIAICFPMKGEQKYRLILIPKSGDVSSNTTDISLEEFRSIAKSIFLDKIKILESTWLTRFKVHHRMTREFQKGRFFLAGDAAHIHSPAGGQGMNIGIQDAINLAYKIKQVVDGQKPFSHLANYQKERMPVARNVLKSTDFIFKHALLPESSLLAIAGKAILPHLVRSTWIQQRVALAMSEVNVARREIQHYS